MSRRSEKVAEAIRRTASLLIVDAVKDPRVGFVTVTRVKVPDDLRSATIFYTVLGTEKDKKSSRSGLKSALSFIRGEIGHRLELRYIPEIFFEEDRDAADIQRLNILFKTIHDENVEGGPDAGE